MSKEREWIIFSKLEEEIKQANLDGNENLELKLLKKYFSRTSIASVDYYFQNQYAYLLKKTGEVNKSINISKKVLDGDKVKSKLYAYENIIDGYLYLNNYDEASRYLYQLLKEDEIAMNSPHIYLCYLELEKENELIIKKDSLEYYQSQVINHSKERFDKYMSSYFNKGRSYNQFLDDVLKEDLTKNIEENLPLSIKSYDSYAVDIYYFDVGNTIGYNKDKKELTGLKVVTLKNSNKLLSVEPIDVIDTNKILLVNHFSYNKKEDTAKVLHKSQIDKFNKRYRR